MDRLLSDEQRVEWLRLLRSDNVGPATFRTLVNRFGGATQALEALPGLYRRGGMGDRLRIYSRAEALRDIERAQAMGARFIAIGEAGYPPMLRQIYKAPILLCMKGDLAVLDRPLAAVIGARTASALGLKLRANWPRQWPRASALFSHRTFDLFCSHNSCLRIIGMRNLQLH